MGRRGAEVGGEEAVGLQGAGATKRHISAGVLDLTGAQFVTDTPYKGAKYRLR